MKIGKHRGESFADVAAQDRQYCAWILREKDLATGLKKFKTHLENAHGGIVPVGKHKGKYFDELLVSEPGYCKWVSTLKKDPGAFGPLIQYMECPRQRKDEGKVERKVEGKNEEPAKKKQRVDVDMCRICFQHNINTCLVPCGHMVACLSCAERLREEPCPICRRAVDIVQKTYHA